MAFPRGDVVLVPFPFTDLSTRKVRPAVVLSSSAYQATEPDLILGALTTNLSAATAPVDYVLADWQAASLRYPSAFKPILFALNPTLILHTVGSLSAADLTAVDRRLRLVLDLPFASLPDLLALTDLKKVPAAQVQTLAEIAIGAVLFQASQNAPEVDLDSLRTLLSVPKTGQSST